MKFSTHTALDMVLQGLFIPYENSVPDVKTITTAMISQGLIKKQADIINDHIAFRTLGMDCLGINSLERIFLHLGYTKQDHYFFNQKKLDAFWYKPPSEKYPRVFISELRLQDLSTHAQNILAKYTKDIKQDPIDDIDLDSAKEVVSFLHRPLWDVPTWDDYQKLGAETEYGAWVLYNRYYLNHYTISVHALPEPYNNLNEFNSFLKSIGIKLNNAGGEIKTSGDKLLRQSSSVAQMVESVFANGAYHAIPGSYVEFAERSVLPKYSMLPEDKITIAHRRDGFEVNNANKIFESTFQKQTNR